MPWKRPAPKPRSPTLICAKTIIGFGAPNKQGTESCHGAALGDDEDCRNPPAPGLEVWPV